MAAEKEITIIDIIRTIRQELGQLKKDKQGLDRSLKAIKTELKMIENKEFSLRDRLTELIQTEMKLNNKRLSFEKRMLKLKDKMSKVKRINKELNDIWS